MLLLAEIFLFEGSRYNRTNLLRDSTMKRIVKVVTTSALCAALLTACNTNHPTGSATGTIVGAAAGAGGIALLGGSKPLIALGGIGGGALGYYVTTLRYDAGGLIQGGGQVYTIGQNIGIYIPTDNLFEPNTASFLPQAAPILDSVAAILQRYPNNNIMISGNTSGFARARWELKLSEKRAQRVAAYLWNQGINQFKENSNETRKLNYVGYGNFFPISHDYTNEGIRTNSRIQITSYPSDCDLGRDKRHSTIHNVGALDDSDINDKPTCGKGKNNCMEESLDTPS